MSEMTALKPRVEKNVFIAPGAQIVGDVVLLEGANIWYNAVLRGDEAQITVGRASNIQDNCTLHCDSGVPLVIGDNVTIGHNVVLHSCTIGDGSLIGIGSVVLGGATIGKGCLIAAGSIVTPRTVIPDGSLFMGAPAKLRRMLSEDEQNGQIKNSLEYIRLVAEYKSLQVLENEKNCVLSKGLSKNRFDTVKNLVDLCDSHEQLNLKLNWSSLEHRDPSEANDIFYYENGVPVGYLGLYSFSENPCRFEVTGLVIPSHRRKGIFRAMFKKATQECKSRGADKIMLVTDCLVASGAEFASQQKLSFERRELAMSCIKSDWKPSSGVNLTFRKASDIDVKELAFLDMMCFEIKNDVAGGVYNEGLRGEVFIAQENGKPIGKVGITKELVNGNIYGLGVIPGCRKRGLGREILEFALDKIFESSRPTALLEINENNIKAVSLFASSGFKTITKHDYYTMQL